MECNAEYSVSLAKGVSGLLPPQHGEECLLRPCGNAEMSAFVSVKDNVLAALRNGFRLWFWNQPTFQNPE